MKKAFFILIIVILVAICFGCKQANSPSSTSNTSSNVPATATAILTSLGVKEVSNPPAAVLHQHGDRGARLHRRSALSGLARMCPGFQPGDGFHLGEQHHADRRGSVGLRLRRAYVRLQGPGSLRS